MLKNFWMSAKEQFTAISYYLKVEKKGYVIRIKTKYLKKLWSYQKNTFSTTKIVQIQRQNLTISKH